DQGGAGYEAGRVVRQEAIRDREGACVVDGSAVKGGVPGADGPAGGVAGQGAGADRQRAEIEDGAAVLVPGRLPIGAVGGVAVCRAAAVFERQATQGDTRVGRHLDEVRVDDGTCVSAAPADRQVAGPR